MTEVLIRDGVTEWVADATEIIAYMKANGWTAGAMHHTGDVEIDDGSTPESDSIEAYTALCDSVGPVRGEGAINPTREDDESLPTMDLCCGGWVMSPEVARML